MRAVIAVQGLGYVTAHNGAYIAPSGCLHLPQLACGRGSWSRFQSGNSLSTRSLAAEHDLTGNPAEAAATFGSGRMAWPGNSPQWGATVLLERTRTICIGYGLIAGMG
jgi:hypothetical protein